MYAARLLEERQAEIKQELQGLRHARREAVGVTTPNVNRLLDFQRYELLVQAQLNTLQQQQVTLEAEVERRRVLLAEAEQQVRVLDKLDERRRTEYHARQLQQEEQVLNEIALQVYLRHPERAGL